MTLYEMSEYQKSWMKDGGVPVKLHKELLAAAIHWCGQVLEPHQWKLVTETGPNEHTFWFESQKASQHFAQEFYDYGQI